MSNEKSLFEISEKYQIIVIPGSGVTRNLVGPLENKNEILPLRCVQRQNDNGQTIFQMFLTICLILVSILNHAQAQTEQSVFERITMEQGLSQSSVFSIAQDHKGFLWFGTQEGLNKYDGYSFKIYRHTSFDSQSVSDNYINTVLVDRNGTLWTGTQFGGLNRFINATEKFIHYSAVENDLNSLSDNNVLSLYEDRDGTLWIGTVNGLNKKERGEEKFSRYYPDSSHLRSSGRNIIMKVYEDRKERLWIGIQGAIAQFDRHRNQFHYYRTDIPVTAVNGFAEDSLGTLWCVASEGVFRLVDDRWIGENALNPSDGHFDGESILRERNGHLWIGTKQGLIRFDPYTKEQTRFRYDPLDSRSLSGNTALSLFEDRTGILWIGTYDGISKYAQQQTRFRHIVLTPDKVKSGGAGWNKIRSFSEGRSGAIWVATQEGVMKYDPATKQLDQLTGKNAFHNYGGTNTVWALEADRKAKVPTMWLGSNGNGLIQMQVPAGAAQPVYSYRQLKQDDQNSISANTIWCLRGTATGDLWIGTLMEGLNRFDPETNSFTRYQFRPDDPKSIGNNNIWSLYEDRGGTLWVGTAGGGLNKFIPTTNEFIRYQNDPRNSNSISDNKITSIIEDRSGMLWIGTYAGLNRFDPKNETFKIYTMNDGLPNEVIYAIKEDDHGDLWISTNKGLSRFTIEHETFRNYDVGDGLQNNEFNMGAAYKTRSGELLFGGINGFNIFRPETIVDNPAIPPVVLTDIKLSGVSIGNRSDNNRMNKEISEIDTLILSYKDAVFSLSFAALDFTNPSKNRYAFMLEGFDREWRNAGGRREATYTNIDPGGYRFRVKASNNDGVWNEEGRTIHIIITPPWWGTLWFRLMVIAGFLSIGPLIYFRRVSALKKKNALQQEFSRQLIESQEQERKRIAAELHDSVGQDLLIIKNKLLYEMDHGGTSAKQWVNLNDVVEYITKSLKNVREISRNLRPIQLDQLGLTTALESVLETIAESSSIQFTTYLNPIDDTFTKENEINFFRIVQECLNNILKHSNATEVNVEVKKTENTVTMMIKDNGVGISIQKERSGFGMSSMQERARILGGTLEIISQAGEGTTIRLTVPFI